MTFYYLFLKNKLNINYLFFNEYCGTSFKYFTINTRSASHELWYKDGARSQIRNAALGGSPHFVWQLERSPSLQPKLRTLEWRQQAAAGDQTAFACLIKFSFIHILGIFLDPWLFSSLSNVSSYLIFLFRKKKNIDNNLNWSVSS